MEKKIKEINKEILEYIAKIEIKKEPEWANTIKNNLMVFYSWLLEKKIPQPYTHPLFANR